MDFSNLVLDFVKGNEQSLKEAFKQLESIGFDRTTSANIIDSEVHLIKKRKINHIRNDYYKNNTVELPKPIEEYDLFFEGMISEDALLFSEIINLYYAMRKIIKDKNNNYSYEVIEEIHKLYGKGIDSLLLEIIYNRFNYMYHIANRDIPRSTWIDNTLVDKFIELELQKKES